MGGRCSLTATWGLIPRSSRSFGKLPTSYPRSPATVFGSNARRRRRRIIFNASFRSACPLGGTIRKSTQSPFRFSISTCPEYDIFAVCPFPFVANFDSGSVVDSCVSFFRFLPRKFTDGLPGSSGGSRSSFRSPLGRKLFKLAHASIKVPSTVKCSCDIKFARFAARTTSSKKCWAIS